MIPMFATAISILGQVNENAESPTNLISDEIRQPIEFCAGLIGASANYSESGRKNKW